MTDLDELLQRDARRWRAEFQPPELAAMVTTATRPGPGRARWVWPILAAVLLLAIPLLTVLLRHHPAAQQPANQRPGLKLLGSVPWVQAVSQTDGRSLSVYVDIDRIPGGCVAEFPLPILQASAVETSTQVTIRVQAFQPADYRSPSPPPGVALGCAAMAFDPVPLLVSLGGPLDGRSVIDASTGKTYQARPAVDLPRLTRLPTGYLDAGSNAAHSADQVLGLVDHTYRNGDLQLLLIRTEKAGHPFYALNKVETTGSVLGHPAKVGGPGNSEYRCAEWSDHSYLWQLCSTAVGPAADRLSAAELLNFANGIR